MLLITLLLAAGCAKKPTEAETALIGNWKDNGSITYEFSGDHNGKCSIYGRPTTFTWSIQQDGKVKIENNGAFFLVEQKGNQLVFGSKTFTKVP
jgi:hypothetical protein